MKNLKEIQEKYRKYFNGLGHVRWGGKSYYGINSDKPLNLNSYGGEEGFKLNELGQVELWETKENHIYTYFYKGQEVSEEDYWRLEDDGVSDDDLTLKSEGCKKYWGLTLDNYFPHPWYPEKEIISFEIINNLPYFDEGGIYEVEGNLIRSDEDFELAYFTWQCLEHPEFFKPIYKL